MAPQDPGYQTPALRQAASVQRPTGSRELSTRVREPVKGVTPSVSKIPDSE
ncbi:hypothetical protein FOYG_03462 [Fusarium oxysporum NRRL 32931]|uniref:Uncharacterized protein n=1 Tax=Fusarium oxysporum NRRL 32931 TaxID=660029 RepID=W9J1I8_FUSOX|nr:hypothetical protein FOYG_03462 [Fusarium oxysporum NRRL 32931]